MDGKGRCTFAILKLFKYGIFGQVSKIDFKNCRNPMDKSFFISVLIGLKVEMCCMIAHANDKMKFIYIRVTKAMGVAEFHAMTK